MGGNGHLQQSREDREGAMHTVRGKPANIQQRKASPYIRTSARGNSRREIVGWEPWLEFTPTTRRRKTMPKDMPRLRPPVLMTQAELERAPRREGEKQMINETMPA